MILCTVLTGMWPCQSLVLAQQQKRLTDTVYKKSILQKIDSLIDSKLPKHKTSIPISGSYRRAMSAKKWKAISTIPYATTVCG